MTAGAQGGAPAQATGDELEPAAQAPSPANVFQNAHQLYVQGHYVESNELCRSILRTQPERSDALLLAGALRSEGAYRAGWVLQGVAISLGVLVPMMFFLGAVFGLLWGTADLLGRKIDRERAAAYAALEDSSDPHSDPDPA